MSDEPKVLIFDIETAPLEVYCWGLWNQNIGLSQIIQDWSVLSWSAKWLDKKRVMYKDTSKKDDFRDDYDVVKAMWDLLDEADIVVTHNGKRFDEKKLNSRFIHHGLTPPSPYQHVDTVKLAKKYGAFTSNKLAYLTDKLCTDYVKSSHGDFPGFLLWKECLKGNKKAWKEMKEYNEMDVLSLEELYLILRVWDNQVNHQVYHDPDRPTKCECGGTKFHSKGYKTTRAGRYRTFSCQNCGKWYKGSTNHAKTKKGILK